MSRTVLRRSEFVNRAVRDKLAVTDRLPINDGMAIPDRVAVPRRRTVRNQPGPILNAELVYELRDVAAHGDRRDLEPLRDLRRRVAATQHAEHL